MSEHLFGESVRIGNTFTDVDGAVYDPTTVSLSITDAIGTAMVTATYAGGDVVRDSEGVYYYDYISPADSTAQGYWMGVWTITVSGQTDKSEEQFYVRPANEKLYISVGEVKDALMSTGVTMTDDTIRNSIRGSMGEVDTITGRTFTNGNTATEWFNTNQANVNTVLNQIFLTYLPVQGVTSLKEYNTSKAVVVTYTEDDYWVESDGVVELCTSSFVHQRRRVECVYTYGYETVPMKISELCSVIAQIKVMRSYMIEQDDKITGFEVPDIGSIQLGETYMTAKLAIADLEAQKKILVGEIGNLRNDIFVV